MAREDKRYWTSLEDAQKDVLEILSDGKFHKVSIGTIFMSIDGGPKALYEVRFEVNDSGIRKIDDEVLKRREPKDGGFYG